MKRLKEPLPNFGSSFTHSCNNLATYEIKKNPRPNKNNATTGSQLFKKGTTVSDMIQSKSIYEKK